MATAIHHHSRAEHFAVPAGVYWAAGLVLALMVLMLAFSTSTGTHVAATLTEPPMFPFIPLM